MLSFHLDFTRLSQIIDFGLDQEDFSPESIELAKPMLLGSSFKAMVTGYHYDNTPFIQLSRRADFVSDRNATDRRVTDLCIVFSNVW